jgi:voltage-gated potassium channel
VGRLSRESRLLGARGPEALESWQRRTDGPLRVHSVVFLVVFVLPLYLDTLPGSARQGLLVVNIAVWAALAVDYAIRLRLAGDRRAFVRGHFPDLLAIVVPFLRPLRLLRLVGILGTASRRAGNRVQLRTTAYLVAAILVLLVVSAGLILDAERGAEGANITNAGDALWWAATTVTTVGYGDQFPVTAYGRVIAVLLMLGGIALLGVVTASVAAWFVKHFSALERTEVELEAEATMTTAALQQIASRLERIEKRLEGRHVDGLAD